MAIELTSETPIAPEATDRIVALRPGGGTPNEKTVVLNTGPLIGRWISALGSISGATVLDLNTANIFSATITGDVTFSFTNPLPTGQAVALILILTNPGAGVITWPGSVDFGDDGEPALPAAGLARLSFVTIDGGTTWTGVLTFMRQD